MSYATMDCIKTQDELSDDCHISLNLVNTYYDRYVQAEVGRYLLLETAEERTTYKASLKPTYHIHQRIQRLIATFESADAEIPAPVVSVTKTKPPKTPKKAPGIDGIKKEVVMDMIMEVWTKEPSLILDAQWFKDEFKSSRAVSTIESYLNALAKEQRIKLWYDETDPRDMHILYTSLLNTDARFLLKKRYMPPDCIQKIITEQGQ